MLLERPHTTHTQKTTMKATHHIVSALAFVLIASCSPEKPLDYQSINGNAQGTTWSIRYFDPNRRDIAKAVDSIFNSIDNSLSTYKPTSLISDVNKGKINNVDDHFTTVFGLSKSIYETTNGVFDPTISPLVWLWKNSLSSNAEPPDSLVSAVLQQRCGLGSVSLSGHTIVFQKDSMYLNLNAIAQGYTVDVLADYLLSMGINDFLVEVGGEVRSSGKGPHEGEWYVGLETVFTAARLPTFSLVNMSVATSGNKDLLYSADSSKKYSKIFNPVTGRPAPTHTHSVSVFAPSCAQADAFATALVAMGPDSAISFATAAKNFSAVIHFRHNDADSIWMSEGAKALLVR